MIIKRYNTDDAPLWDQFVEDSKNGTFLFMRNYMDYHSDRFVDHSLIIEDKKGKVIALIPANETIIKSKKVFYSHQGLTYGGLILSEKNKVSEVLEIFENVISYLKQSGFHEWIYKQIPTIYHKFPSEEDTYALWRHNATMSACQISVTIALETGFNTIPPEPERKRGRSHALLENYRIIETSTPDLFWPIMEKNLLDKYNTSPVHTVDEMQLLMSRFPQKIKCFLAMKNGVPQAGAIVYIANQKTVHLQYCHASEEGKKDRVMDLFYIYLPEYFQNQKFQYFDFGTNNEDGGHYLNQSLIAHKQSFGARGIAYNTYLINLA